MSFIGRAWRGEEKLWKVFWYGVLVSIALQAFFIVMAMLAGIPFEHKFYLSDLSLVMVGAVFLAGAVSFSFQVWQLVSLWRCAWNAGARFWGYLVRILIVGPPVFGGVYFFAMVVFISIKEHANDAECRKIAVENAKMLGLSPLEYREQHGEEMRACLKTKNAELYDKWSSEENDNGND